MTTLDRIRFLDACMGGGGGGGGGGQPLIWFNSPFQHGARVVLLAEFNTQSVLFAEFNTQSVLFQDLMSTHGASCFGSTRSTCCSTC